MPPTESTTLSPGIIAAIVIPAAAAIAVPIAVGIIVCLVRYKKQQKKINYSLVRVIDHDSIESQPRTIESLFDHDLYFNIMPHPCAMETPPCHVTDTETDQYTRDNDPLKEPLQGSQTTRYVRASETDQYTKDNEPLKTSVTIAIEGEDHQNIAGRNSGEIFQATPQPENPFLPRYSADPYNTAQYIPKWMDPVATLTDCTSDGRSYYDEHNDFRLEIPEGAIPEGERVTIDIGVALYGPFQYLTGLRPVSPVFWVCVRGRENFRFLKPVKVTTEHCLSLDRDTDTHSLGLTFMKAGHTLNSAGKYELQSADGAQDFQSDLSHGTLTTDHFCFFCINAKDDHETAKRNCYFLIRAHVKPIPTRGDPVMEFIVTLRLECCVNTVEIQCQDKGYSVVYSKFHFKLKNEDSHGSLEIDYKEPEMWNICLQSSKKVSISYMIVYYILPLSLIS